MTDARFVWTPLPNHTWPDGELRLSVYLSPRLAADGVIEDYEALHDWPSVLSEARFRITIDGGPEFMTSAASKADSDLWQRSFPLDLPIKAFAFEDHALKNFHVFPVRPILQFIADTYGALAEEAGLDHPSIDDPGAPLRPFTHLAGIATQIADLQSFHEELNDGQPLTPAAEGPQPVGEVKVDQWGDGGVGQDFMQGYRFYYRPGNRPKKPPTKFVQPYPPEPKRDDFDFARIVAMLGDHPVLLRRLGLIVDLTIEGSIPDDGVIRVEPVDVKGIVPVPTPPPLGTAYEREEAYFWAKPADPMRMQRGVLRMSPEWFDLFQVDVDGALMKLVDFADTLSRLRDRDRRSDATPGEAPVPILRGGGLSVARFHRGDQLIDDLVGSRDLNDKLDSGTNVVLNADDLARGYRIDVWDADAHEGPRWFSLHRRRSTHTVADLAAGGEPTEIEHEDEGYLKGTGATSESEDHASPSTDLYLHETMFGWEGWSLSAPRPGTRIVEPGQADDGGDVERFDPGKDNPLPIVTRTSVSEGSLPSLRFGHTYRVRARLADLAGGGLDFAEGDFPDPTGDLTSPERRYLRYEPIPSPTVLRRFLDTEGESLEHLVIRSNAGVTAAAYPSLPAVVAALEEAGAEHVYREDAQRHLAPPKTSELMAEQHGRFDTAFGDATDAEVAKALHTALREEGSFLDRTIVDLTTGLSTINQSGIALHPAVAPKDWPAKGAGLDPGQVVLLSADSVLLPYLPDPLAIGVAVTGYDHAGAEVFHETAEFGGAWPELKPFRIRLSELAGANPPSAAFENGVLEIRLSKADVVDVRLSSIFPANDLDLFAVWNLIQNPTPDLKQRALEGRHWMLTPFRWLRFTHAVQQPLEEPHFQAVEPQDRPIGATSAVFHGPIGCHAKSTGRLDVMGAWTEDVDLVTDEDGPRWKAGGNPVAKTARAFGFDIDPGEENAQVTVTWKVQDGWRWCRRCEGLFYGGRPTKGACPAEAGTSHADDASGNYVLAHDDDDASGQAGWRWCHKCEGLFFAVAGSHCPAGGEHDTAGSGAYTLVHQQPNAPGQNGWRYCSKCKGLAWGVDQPGACPAGGVHEHSASGVYTLRTVVTAPQDRVSRHEFGDTKYRRIQYHALATTRFREHLPPPLYRSDESVLQRPETAVHTRDILSSARPAAPDVVYIVPTFGWETSEEGDATVHVRRGKGVRVYVRRPWFSSGDGELLGVVLRNPEKRIFGGFDHAVVTRAPLVATRAEEQLVGAVRAAQQATRVAPPSPASPPSAPPSPNPGFEPFELGALAEGIVLPPGVVSALNKDPLEGFVTAWGSDPVWRSAYPPESPSAYRFPAHVDFAANLTLGELASSFRVAVAAHAVQYQPTRRLWYSDIEVDMGDAYYPFVRLALARFQPNSVEDAHLSRVIMTDFVQLAPDRRTAVTLAGDAADIQVQGVFGQNRIGNSPPSLEKPAPSTEMWARLEVHDDAMGGDLAWKPASDPVELHPVDLDGYRATWSGSVGVPAGALGDGTHRLMITESERYRRDYEPGDPMYAIKDMYTNTRIVFADEFVL